MVAENPTPQDLAAALLEASTLTTATAVIDRLTGAVVSSLGSWTSSTAVGEGGAGGVGSAALAGSPGVEASPVVHGQGTNTAAETSGITGSNNGNNNNAQNSGYEDSRSQKSAPTSPPRRRPTPGAGHTQKMSSTSSVSSSGLPSFLPEQVALELVELLRDAQRLGPKHHHPIPPSDDRIISGRSDTTHDTVHTNTSGHGSPAANDGYTGPADNAGSKNADVDANGTPLTGNTTTFSIESPLSPSDVAPDLGDTGVRRGHASDASLVGVGSYDTQASSSLSAERAILAQRTVDDVVIACYGLVQAVAVDIPGPQGRPPVQVVVYGDDRFVYAIKRFMV